jgi:type IV pilus assembly protein PilB
VINKIDLDFASINTKAMTMISKEVCEEYSVFPYDIRDNHVYLATFKEHTNEEINRLRFILKKKVILNLCTIEQFKIYLNKYYEEIYRKQIVKELKGEEDTRKEVDKKVKGPIISLVDSIFREGIEKGASDIHIEPWKDTITVRYRIDGVLNVFSTLPRNLYEVIATRIKVMASMDITNKYTPEDGEISLNVEEHPHDLRISTMPTVHGEKFVIRILQRNAPLLNINKLGFMPRDYLLLKNILRFKQGLIIITGPTGSGKTTTLYSMINELNEKSRNIVTVEKPVECEVEGINQVSIGEGSATYGNILKAVLRQDPDVIMVGEIIDKETAEVAIRASLTGHLVLTTLHTNDASSAINRLTNMDIDGDIIKSSLVLVIAQRLTRLICKECKVKYKLSKEERNLMEINNIEEAYKGIGCAKCNNTGYRGRTVAYETMIIGKRVKEHMEKGDSDILRNIAIEEGMVTMDEYFRKLVADGSTTVEEYYGNMQVYNIEKALGVDYGI